MSGNPARRKNPKSAKKLLIFLHQVLCQKIKNVQKTAKEKTT